MNKVIAGKYKDKGIVKARDLIIAAGFTKSKQINLNKDTVEEFRVLDEEEIVKMGSLLGRGAVGGLVLGPLGVLAGATAKKKRSYVVKITYKDSDSSILELDKKSYLILENSLS